MEAASGPKDPTDFPYSSKGHDPSIPSKPWYDHIALRYTLRITGVAAIALGIFFIVKPEYMHSTISLVGRICGSGKIVIGLGFIAGAAIIVTVSKKPKSVTHQTTNTDLIITGVDKEVVRQRQEILRLSELCPLPGRSENLEQLISKIEPADFLSLWGVVKQWKDSSMNLERIKTFFPEIEEIQQNLKLKQGDYQLITHSRWTTRPLTMVDLTCIIGGCLLESGAIGAIVGNGMEDSFNFFLKRPHCSLHQSFSNDFSHFGEANGRWAFDIIATKDGLGIRLNN